MACTVRVKCPHVMPPIRCAGWAEFEVHDYWHDGEYYDITVWEHEVPRAVAACIAGDVSECGNCGGSVRAVEPVRDERVQMIGAEV